MLEDQEDSVVGQEAMVVQETMMEGLAIPVGQEDIVVGPDLAEDTEAGLI